MVNGSVGGAYLLDFQQTLDCAGVMWPCTCSCGEPGCAGYNQPVGVTHRPGVVRWHVPPCYGLAGLDRGVDDGLYTVNHLTFDASQYW